jgi:hypothetical protein
MRHATRSRRAWDYALAAAFPLALAAGPASADDVHLVGGTQIEGKATRQGDKVVIQLESGQIALSASSVQRIEHKPSALDGAAALAAKLKPGDVAGLFALADYCRDNGLPVRERESLERILELEPDHARARARLGYVKREGRWITYDEQMRADGFVREAGQWLSREQAAELAQMRAARDSAERERERAREQQQLEHDRKQRELASEAQRSAPEAYVGGYYALPGFAPYWWHHCRRGDCDRDQIWPTRATEPSASPPARSRESRRPPATRDASPGMSVRSTQTLSPAGVVRANRLRP